MRVCHYIKPNARSESPTRAIWFQPWTYPLHLTKYETEYAFEFIRVCRGAKDTKTDTWSFTWYTVRTASEFWTLVDSLTAAKTKTYIFSQLPTIDLTLISAFTETVKHGWNMTLAVIPPAPTICRWRKANKSIVLLGVSNIWPMPLPTISTGKTECMHAKMNESSEPCEHVSLIDGVLNSLKTVVVEWWQFLKENDLGGFSPTAGAQSSRVWRHKYMTHRVLIDCHDDALRLAREAVYGARCEVFRDSKPTGKVYELDTNGAYGGIMRDLRVPVKLRSHRYHLTCRDLHEWVQDSVCIARVDVDCPLPVFPMRRDRRFAFTHGRFNTVLAGEALQFAVEGGYVRDVYECAVYEEAPAFKAYMEALWVLRKLSESLKNKNDAEKYKLLNSSFWGRWAQRGRVWEKTGEAVDMSIRYWIDVSADTGEITEWRQFGGIVQRLCNEEESRESSPAIAACVIAGGHMQMWRYMAQCGLEHVYYCDTDALFTNEVGVERLSALIKPDELGMLKIKGAYDSVTFLAQKHILTDGARRLAGVSQLSLHTVAGDTYTTQNIHSSEWIRRSEQFRPVMKEVKRGDLL